METTSVKEYARTAAGTHEREREKEGPPVSLTLSDDSTLVCDVFMAAAGRTPNTAWLEGTGVGLGKRGHIEVDSKLQSSSRNGVWAAGDVLPPPSAALASTAVEEGARAVSAMFGEGEGGEGKEGEEAGGAGGGGGGGGGGGSEFPCGIWTIPEVGELVHTPPPPPPLRPRLHLPCWSIPSFTRLLWAHSRQGEGRGH